MTLFTTGDGNTPLSPEEQDALIPDLTTKEELNEWERQNILEASAWALDPRNSNRQDPFSEPYLRELVTCVCSTRPGSGQGSTGPRKRTSAFLTTRSVRRCRLCWVMRAIG